MGMFLSMADLGQTQGDPAAMEAQADALEKTAASYRASGNPDFVNQARALEAQAQSLRMAATAIRAQQAKEAAESAATQGAVLDLVGKILTAGASVGGSALLAEQQRKAERDRLKATLSLNNQPVSAPPQSPVVVQSGISTGTVVALGLGAAAVAGLVAVLALRKSEPAAKAA